MATITANEREKKGKAPATATQASYAAAEGFLKGLVASGKTPPARETSDNDRPLRPTPSGDKGGKTAAMAAAAPSSLAHRERAEPSGETVSSDDEPTDGPEDEPEDVCMVLPTPQTKNVGQQKQGQRRALTAKLLRRSKDADHCPRGAR